MKCYMCEGQLDGFHEPWLAHSLVSPLCPHLLLFAPLILLAERYTVCTARVESFSTAPDIVGISAEEFAHCGFFFCRSGDSVRCCSCGEVLRSWERGDDPWLEHWRFSPKCPLLQKQPPCSPSWLAVCLQSSISQRELGLIVASHSLSDVKVALERWPGGLSLTAGTLSKQLAAVVKQRRPNGSGPAAVAFPMPSKRDTCTCTSSSTAASAETTVEASPAKSPRVAQECEDRLSCGICFDDERCIVFQPCGHMMCCASCSDKVQKCPACRKSIHSRIRVFL